MEIEFTPAREDFEDGIYDIDEMLEYHDNDAISAEEAAFMAGYLAS